MANNNGEFNEMSDPIETDFLYDKDFPVDKDLEIDETDNKPHVSYKRKRKQKSSNSMDLYDWVQCIISALLCGIIIFLFVGRVVGVSGTSMLPTLMHGDRAIISNLFYTPSYGDIVIIQKESFSKDPIVKRVIATEGQTVDIDFDAGIVYVDGVALEEDYTNSLTTSRLDFSGEVTVPDNCIFVLGDNRNGSTDSRDADIGMVDIRCIIGKVYFIIYPGTDINGNRDWSRIGSPY